MYVAWFQSPQGVEEPFVVVVKGRQLRGVHGSEVLSAQVEGGVRWISGINKAAIGAILFLVFTSINLASWNYPFPTKVEVYLW